MTFSASFGIVPSLGRYFLPEQGKVAGQGRFAVLGYDLWKTQYGVTGLYSDARFV